MEMGLKNLRYVHDRYSLKVQHKSIYRYIIDV